MLAAVICFNHAVKFLIWITFLIEIALKLASINVSLATCKNDVENSLQRKKMSDHETQSTASASISLSSPFLPGYAFKQPEPVKLNKNGIENWKMWKQLWKHYCIVSNADLRSPDFRKSLLISTLGIEALLRYC